MNLIFLSERDLSVLDYAFATNDFEIVLDALVPQKSSFKINKKTINAGIGDYLTIRDNNYSYIGVITAIDEDSKGGLKISTKEFLSKFDVKVPVKSYNGNVSQFLIDLIRNNFVISSDSSQNMRYLQTEIEYSKTASISYDDDQMENILDLVEEFSKTYGVRLSYELVISQGSITNIKVKAISVIKGVVLRSDLGTISDLIISDTNEASINKVIFVPKKANTTYKSVVSYFLLNDGTISTSYSSDKRIVPVVFKCESYSDNDYPNLKTKATSSLVDSSLEHSISFTFAYGINKVDSLKELGLGTYVEFITPKKVYETLVTKITYKGTFEKGQLVLGEYRTTLTDKLKLLNRKGK